MSTPLAREVFARMARANDQLCFAYFVAEVGAPHIAAAVAANPALRAAELFPNVAQSKRINVPGVDLLSMQKMATTTLASFAIVTSVEYLLGYMEDVEAFRAEVIPSPHDGITADKPEDRLAAKLSAWGIPLDCALVKTLRYLRLRRNHIAHANDLPATQLSTLIKNDATHLTNYWTAQPTRLPGITFSNASLSPITDSEAYSLLNLSRASLVKIDEAILASIPIAILTSHEVKKFQSWSRYKAIKPEVRLRKFKFRFKEKYGGLACCSNLSDFA